MFTSSGKVIKGKVTNRGNPGENGTAVPPFVCVCLNSLFVCLPVCFCTCSMDMKGREKVSGREDGHVKEVSGEKRLSRAEGQRLLQYQQV